MRWIVKLCETSAVRNVFDFVTVVGSFTRGKGGMLWYSSSCVCCMFWNWKPQFVIKTWSGKQNSKRRRRSGLSRSTVREVVKGIWLTVYVTCLVYIIYCASVNFACVIVEKYEAKKRFDVRRSKEKLTHLALLQPDMLTKKHNVT